MRFGQNDSKHEKSNQKWISGIGIQSSFDGSKSQNQLQKLQSGLTPSEISNPAQLSESQNPKSTNRDF